MRDHGAFPLEEEICNMGREWLLMLLDRFPAKDMANLLMILWHVWHVRNSITQEEKWIAIEASVIFLTNYMNSLLGCNTQHMAEVQGG